MTFTNVGEVFDGDAITHTQTIMDNGVIIVPPHDFKHPSCLYYQVWKLQSMSLEESQMAQRQYQI
jgi:hypothetical protein